jgi:KDO2-lipid IV(A) lauroyltransferase
MDSKPSLYSPRYWPWWIAVGTLWLHTRLPVRWQLASGRVLGRLFYRLFHRRRRIAAINLELCFPELTPAQRYSLLREHFEGLGLMLVEIAIGWWVEDRRLRGIGVVEGLEHLNRAVGKGRGVLLLAAHFTAVEMGGRVLAMTVDHPFLVVQRPHENPVLQYCTSRGRERRFGRVYSRDDIRGILRSLKSGHVLWYAPDQAYTGPRSILAPFFGVPAASNPATARIARISGAAVVPFFTLREPGGRYRLRLLPALENFPGGDVEADTARINKVIEDQVRQAPAQYYWVHRRFKRRGTADPYND